MPSRLQAAVFDLDGVITRTEKVHFAAWKELFDGLLTSQPEQPPFTEAVYRAHVDGRPRLDGIREFLAVRGISIPDGSSSDEMGEGTIHGLGKRKNELFGKHLQRLGVEVDHEAVRLVREIRAADVPVAMATSSKNGARILEAGGLEDLFDARVDGINSERLGLRGKPDPDIFITALERLGRYDPAHAMVVEDAPAGVAAGRAAGFGLVLGVDRGDAARELRDHGADVVIEDFAAVSLDWIEVRLSEHTPA